MSEQLTLQAEARERAGKGASRALRREGRVPAVIYGEGQQPVTIHLEEKALVKALSTGHFMNTVAIIVQGGREMRTLPKDVAFHPVSDRPIHADFLRIGEHSRVSVAVPLVFDGADAAPGLEAGGTLTAALHEITLSCDASEIPAEIRVDVSGLALGQSIHLSDIALPTGAEFAGEAAEVTLASMSAPTATMAEEELESPAADEVPATEVPEGPNAERPDEEAAS